MDDVPDRPTSMSIREVASNGNLVWPVGQISYTSNTDSFSSLIHSSPPAEVQARIQHPRWRFRAPVRPATPDLFASPVTWIEFQPEFSETKVRGIVRELPTPEAPPLGMTVIRETCPAFVSRSPEGDVPLQQSLKDFLRPTQQWWLTTPSVAESQRP